MERIGKARELATRITGPVLEFVGRNTTVTVERATLRLVGADGADPDGVPVPNLIVDQLGNSGRLPGGSLRWYVNALMRGGEGPASLNAKIAVGLRIGEIPLGDEEDIRKRGLELAKAGLGLVAGNRARRD